jgi:hypothetical protein
MTVDAHRSDHITPESPQIADIGEVPTTNETPSIRRGQGLGEGTRPNPFIRDAEPSIESLCMSAALGQPQYYGPSSGLNFLRIVSSIMRSVRYQAPGISTSGIKDDMFKNLPKP